MPFDDQLLKQEAWINTDISLFLLPKCRLQHELIQSSFIGTSDLTSSSCCGKGEQKEGTQGHSPQASPDSNSQPETQLNCLLKVREKLQVSLNLLGPS